MSTIRKGTIIGLYREKGSGTALLGIEDEQRGKVLIPADGNPLCRAFDAVFPGTLIGGHTFNNAGIEGEPIYYWLDDSGTLEAFLPLSEATPEVVEEYAKEVKKRPSPRKSGHIGLVEPDDPRILKGPIVAGRPDLKPPKLKPHEFN